VFLVLVVAASAVSFFYFPDYWAITNLAILICTGVLVLFINGQAAKTYEELNVERRRIKGIITFLPEAVIGFDANFKLLTFNEAAERLFNLRKEEVLEKVFSVDSAKDARLKLLAQVIFPQLAPSLVKRSNPGEEPEVTDLIFEEPQMELRVISSKYPYNQGKNFGFSKVITDRTRENALYRAKSEFIGIASRQLKTPAEKIIQALDLLGSQVSGAAVSVFDSARKAAEKLEDIIRDLIDIVKIEEGKFGYKFEELDLAKFSEELLRNALPTARKYGVRVYLEHPPEEAFKIWADHQRLGLVFTNLLDNAMKYNVSNGEVVLSLEKVKNQPYVMVSIADTGVGIPPEDLENLFQKFFRAHNVAELSEGSGLGLYIVKNVIARHGGRVRAESELNRGTTFYFTLPIDKSLIPAGDLYSE